MRRSKHVFESAKAAGGRRAGSRMRRDGDDRHLTLAGSIVPEHPVCARSVVLGIGLEDLLTVRPLEGVVLVRLEAGMTKVGLHQPERFQHRTQVGQWDITLVPPASSSPLSPINHPLFQPLTQPLPLSVGPGLEGRAASWSRGWLLGGTATRRNARGVRGRRVFERPIAHPVSREHELLRRAGTNHETPCSGAQKSHWVSSMMLNGSPDTT